MMTSLPESFIESNEQQRLTQDYLYLINELYKVLAITTIPEEEFLIHEWKDKFINDFFARTDACRTRNIYIAKLIECLRNKKLSGPFCELPPYGELPEYKSTEANFGPPEWLTKMENEQWVTTTGRPFDYYFARKSLDYGRGTCVCIGIAFPINNDDDTHEKWQAMGATGISP